MAIVGTIASLWRYPVKSMRGESMEELFVSYGGVYGDRLFAFVSSEGHKGFPFFTGRDQRQMLRYRPRWRHPEKAARPTNQMEAEALSDTINPITASGPDLMLDVEAPDGGVFAIDNPALLDNLRAGLATKPDLTLLRSDKAMTDCRPLSLFSLQTAEKLSAETGLTVDLRRFRANVYLELNSGEGFAEDHFVGRNLRLGSKVVITILARDSRCMMITLDPDTAEKSPAIHKTIAQSHENKAGVYAAVLMEGMIHQGDSVEIIE